MCCCEALILGFSSEDNGFLFNQVSVWLESDLPIYHWFSEVRAERVVKYFDHLLKRVHRIVFDSNIESYEDTSIDSKLIELKPNSNKSLCFEIQYGHGQFIHWTQFKDSSISHLTQNLRGIEKKLSIQIKPLLPEQELSEAFYF